jgi:chromosome segregation ATPase
LLDLLYWANFLLHFSHALHVMKARISARSAQVQQCSHVAELEEALTQLRAELAAAHTKVEEVERRERSLTSGYDSLRRDFGDFLTSHDAVVKEKANLEKMEREKAQQFCNLLRKKLVGLRCDMEELIVALGGDAWTFSLPMPLSLTC